MPLNNDLTASDSQPFRFDYQNGKYGFVTESGGADTFNPFKGDSIPTSNVIAGGSGIAYSVSFTAEIGAKYVCALACAPDGNYDNNSINVSGATTLYDAKWHGLTSAQFGNARVFAGLKFFQATSTNVSISLLGRNGYVVCKLPD